MSNVAKQSQIRDFYEYLGRRLNEEEADLSPEQSVREFRLYQDELERFLRQTEPAVAQSQRGETRPLDVDAVMDRVQQRWEQHRRED